MKKLFFVAIATVGFAVSGTAQETKIKVGVDVGFPMGDIKDGTSLNLGLNGAYIWENVTEGLDAGVGVSYNTYFAKEVGGVKVDNSSFLPIYGTANYNFTENIFAGADLGYALVLAPSGADGGVYYQPKVGYKTEMYEVFLGYKAISSKTTFTDEDGPFSITQVFASVNLGFNYKF
jgi:hypothetical protein